MVRIRNISKQVIGLYNKGKQENIYPRETKEVEVITSQIKSLLDPSKKLLVIVGGNKE